MGTALMPIFIHHFFKLKMPKVRLKQPLLLLLTGLMLSLAACRDTAARNEQAPPNGTGSTRNPKVERKAPDYVYEVLQQVRSEGRAPEGYVGGRSFENREKRLPQKDNSGEKIRYREWDVHPKVRGQNRGAERLVTGSDQSAWYTKDHYKKFTRIE
jgi:guanyl-specific ribonuclease Sa